MRSEVYLGLGSNLGDRRANIERGLGLLGRCGHITAVSSMVETAPEGFSRQPPFLNAACRMWTLRDPFELLVKTQEVERAAGRHRVFPNAARTLDVDILVYEGTALQTPHLILPHPRMRERRFVLEPLADIAPYLRHPITGETVAEMLWRLPPDRNELATPTTQRASLVG